MEANTIKTFKSKNWTSRNYECTNVVACQAEKAPNDNWIECDEEILSKLNMLEICAGVRYFGYL
jgi:hypothetical protein